MKKEHIQKYLELFTGFIGAYGQLKNGKHFFLKKDTDFSLYEKHLKGVSGLGIIPINEQSKCVFGALDFDNHNKKDGVDIVALEKKIRQQNLPLVLCRSKSGGAHAYLFTKTPCDAETFRRALKRMLTFLRGFGETEIEIYPKLDKIQPGEYANFINLPYFDSEKENPRYCLFDGKKLTLSEFLEHANEIAIDRNQLIGICTSDQHAPPCIQAMLFEKLSSGQRNNALFNMSVYARQAYEADEWHDKVHEFNQNRFENPLDSKEVNDIIKSIKRNNYKYKCKEEPCVSRCNSTVCVTRKYGITPTEKGELKLSEMPKFGRLKKYLTDPVKWELEVDGLNILMTTEEIMDFRKVRACIFEKLGKVIQPIKNEKWNVILSDLSDKHEIVDVPDDASRDGIIRTFLFEYIKKADLSDSGKDITKRVQLYTSKPLVQVIMKNSKETRCVLFRGTEFRIYLQSKKLGNISSNDIWMAIKICGAKEASVKIGKNVLKVWAIPIGEHDNPYDIANLNYEVDF